MLPPLWDLVLLPVRNGKASTSQARASAPQHWALLIEA